ncbi:bifunctional 2-polyprenyl-6-hydroxyphenol methylase/3-demethylubiquinol 3-O-methyltransferase UbiG [Amycolatopsis sp. YIM 10]|uniref:class I SAM-dependent methyltransferase n=1 Tax=Amycolatopsis sp. YIM 10 TaxID=2653857 RepID=UPI001D1443B5|nr:class I SAM-dependent methyltransferase [Amycolatopsis sp. YIM 10]
MGESFGIDAERYDRARPDYPAPLIASIVEASPGPEILDIGCGTGIAARQFQAAGCTVLGVEPDERMARFARHTGVEVEVARFEDWEPGDRQFDAVTAGQAWHWVDPVAGAVKAAQVLRPRGTLTAFWHEFRAPAEIDAAFARAFERVNPGSPFDFSQVAKVGYQPMLDRAAEGFRAAGAFGEAEQSRYTWERRYTRAEWLDHLPTTGVLTQLPADRLAVVLDEVGAAVDALGGSFTLNFTTVSVTARHVARPAY